MKSYPFGNKTGFGNGRRRDEYYYSQGIQAGQFGPMTGYRIESKIDSATLATLTGINWFATVANILYAQADNGKVFKEANSGAMDFALLASPAASNGQGLLGDAKGRLLVFNDTTIDLYDGSTYTSGWKTGLFSGLHPSDTYQGMTIIGNGPQLALIDSSDALNTSAFTLPTSMRVRSVHAGKNGILIGANLDSRGYLILWDARSNRSINEWIELNGQVQSVSKTESGWIVVTQRQILFTNGYSIEELYTVVDDELGFAEFTLPFQGTAIINHKLLLCLQSNRGGRNVNGLQIFDLKTKTFEFSPVADLSTASLLPTSVAVSHTNQQVALAWTDASKKYIGSFLPTGGSTALYISEVIADSASEKVAEAVVLNLAPALPYSSKKDLSFSVAVKLYNFKRQLWGQIQESGVAPAANKLKVDGSDTTKYRAQIGDEVTVMSGPNAGRPRHITDITDQGTASEVWTLDSALPGATATGITIQIQPFELVSKKTFTSLSELNPQNLFFSVQKSTRGQKFMVKVVFEDLNGLQLELHPSELITSDPKLPS